MEEKNVQSITLSVTEAAEYQAYKREKHILEVMNHIQKSVLDARQEDVKAVTARAVKYGCAAVKVLPPQISLVRALTENSKVKTDCIIGGRGETFLKVKVYETKLARRAGAQELTLCLNESDVHAGRFNEIKKEIKKVCKAAKGGVVKVRLQESWGNETLLKLCRLAFESGAKYVSVCYFEGCERLKNDLYSGLGIEVTDVATLAVFKKMAGAGMQRIQTSRLQHIYEEWMCEAENVTVEQAVASDKADDKTEDMQSEIEEGEKRDKAQKAATKSKVKTATKTMEKPQSKKAQEYRNLISQKQP